MGYRKVVVGWILALTIFTHVAFTNAVSVNYVADDRIVQEKVYLHFDNSNYFLGDTIWYKAYVVRADELTPEPLSRILYVELLNEQGYLMERQQLVLDHEGQAHGQFALADSLFAGYYEVRAYTKWMLNFGYEHLPSWNKKVWWQMEEETALFPLDIPATPPTTEIIHALRAYAPGRGVIMVPKGPSKVPYNNADSFIQTPGIPTEIYEVINITEFNSNLQISRDDARLNYRENHNLFSRVLPVYSRPDSIQNYRRRIMPTKITMGDFEVQWKTPEFDVRFYPEGGALLMGHECRVAWEAMNQQMERFNVTGVLLDGNAIIDTLHAIHAGRGFFSITPQKGHRYQARFTFGNQTFTFRLPEAETEGARIILTQSSSEANVHVDVETQFDTRRYLYLHVYCRGRRVDRQPIGRGKKVGLDIDYYNLPEGVCQALVADSAGVVYADRLFFVDRHQESRGQVMITGIPNRAYRPMEHIRLNLLATDPKGHPLSEQRISVSVRDADQFDPTFATGNIMTNLLLESEIRGFVEMPDYYFEADDSIHRQALDLLMMVQGWRRYDWHDVEHPETARMDYMPEQKTIVSGEVVPLRKSLFGGKDRKIEVQATLVNLNDDLKEGDYYLYKGRLEPDSAGRFTFAYDPFYGNVRLNLKARYAEKDDTEGTIFRHDPKIFVRKQYFYPQALKAYSWYETHQPDTMKDRKLTWQEYQEDIYASEWIPQVTIKSKRRPHAKRQINKPVFSIPFIDFINDMWDQGYYDSFNLMDGTFSLIDNRVLFDGYVRLMYEPETNNYESHVFHLDWSTMNSFKATTHSFLSRLDKLVILSDAPRRPTPFEHYHEDRRTLNLMTTGVDTYFNFMTCPDSTTREMGGREYNFQGFTRPVEYYHPDYSHARLPEVKDYRRTLYWNPDLRTDQYGQATISFYNNSVCTTIDISAEGITRYGQFIINK